MEKWRGKWALVTGASAGIGWALAEQLAAQGANLVLTARRADRLAQLANDLRTRHKVQAEILAGDLARPQTPFEIARFTEQQRLPIEILINNAGFGAYGEFRKIDPVLFYTSLIGACDHLFFGRHAMSRASGVGPVTDEVCREYITHMEALICGGMLRKGANSE